MSEKPFREPKIALNRIYTRRGDAGQTSLVGGQRVPKDSLRIDCYGTVDELNSVVGMVCCSLLEQLPTVPDVQPLLGILHRVQHELFNLGSILATLPQDVHPQQPRVTQEEIDQLEREIDEMNEPLSALRSFVLPGGHRINAELHLCRTICRRAERLAVTLSRQEEIPEETVGYLNRLSDAFFVWSRWASHKLAAPEVLWEPNQSASGRRTPDAG